MKGRTRSTKDSYNKPRDKSDSWKISWKIAGSMKEARKREIPTAHLFKKNQLTNRNMKIFRNTSCLRPTNNHHHSRPIISSKPIIGEPPFPRIMIYRQGITTRKKGKVFPETSIADSWASTETTRDPSPTTKSWDHSPLINSPTNPKDSTLLHPEISKVLFMIKEGT